MGCNKMVDLKRAIEAKSSMEKAEIAIEVIKEAEKISQTKKGSITKENFTEMLFPGISATQVKNAVSVTAVAGVATQTTEIGAEEAIPGWLQRLIEMITGTIYD
jgi:hypothetical protein